MNPKLMSSLELAERAGLTYKQVDHWTKRRFLKPEPNPGGTGHRRAFKPSEVRVAQVMSALVRAGVMPHIAAKAARSAILEADDRGMVFISELIKGVAVTGRVSA
jgi:hypothetical protein